MMASVYDDQGKRADFSQRNEVVSIPCVQRGTDAPRAQGKQAIVHESRQLGF
jgi:hypothetical protein